MAYGCFDRAMGEVGTGYVSFPLLKMKLHGKERQ